jgi:hypothetical protein
MFEILLKVALNTIILIIIPQNRIGGVMISVVASSVVDRVNFQWDDDEVRFLLDQHPELDFYSANSLKQQSAG